LNADTKLTNDRKIQSKKQTRLNILFIILSNYDQGGIKKYDFVK